MTQQTMTPEEAAQKQAAAIVARARLVHKKHLSGLTPDEARRLDELDAHLDDLSTVIYPEFYASLDAAHARLDKLDKEGKQ